MIEGRKVSGRLRFIPKVPPMSLRHSFDTRRPEVTLCSEVTEGSGIVPVSAVNLG